MLLWEEMTRSDLQAAAPDTLVVLPVGAVEQHGPHLPTGTDFFIISHVARQAAQQASAHIPILLAPTMPFGSSHHHLPFGATFSLTTTTYYQVLSELVESLIVSKFSRIFILNGHGGNDEVIQLVARDIVQKHAVHVAAASYWNMAWEALVEMDAHTRGQLPGHAGHFETSMMLHLRSELVKAERPSREPLMPADPRSFYPAYRAEHHGNWVDIDGYTDSPARSDDAQGARYLETVVHVVAGGLVEFSASCAG